MSRCEEVRSSIHLLIDLFKALDPVTSDKLKAISYIFELLTERINYYQMMNKITDGEVQTLIDLMTDLDDMMRIEENKLKL